MRTAVTTDPIEAAAFIKRGGLVAFPTETVYGLGANVFDERAVVKIFDAKRRPPDNPLIAHISNLKEIDLVASGVSRDARHLIDVFFPGPLTVVLSKAEKVPLIATAGLDTVGVRMPDYEFAQLFLASCHTPVVAPSANLSGKPSPTTWQAVAEDLGGRIDCILQGDPTRIGLESTVVDCSRSVPVLLRAGAVPLESIRAVIPDIQTAETNDRDPPRSPGMKHRHYSPTASVVLIDPGVQPASVNAPNAYIGLSEPEGRFEIKLICSSTEQYAHSFFEFFRECDRRGIHTVYCEKVAAAGVGSALMDRLRRAAED